MKQPHDPHLGLGLQVDEKVSTGDHIEPREGRIGEHILYREDDGRAELGYYSVTAVFPSEKAGEAFR
jgi:hypothetical protein